jgi:hypothetical protein
MGLHHSIARFLIIMEVQKLLKFLILFVRKQKFIFLAYYNCVSSKSVITAFYVLSVILLYAVGFIKVSSPSIIILSFSLIEYFKFIYDCMIGVNHLQ